MRRAPTTTWPPPPEASSPPRDRFRLLEQVALHHESLLRRRHAELFPGVDLVVPPSSAAPVPQVEDWLATCAGLRDALRFAVDAERAARGVYLDAAATATDTTGHNMFRYLADAHARHHMELEAEYDLILRYPHAYDDPQAPWRPEG